MIIDIAIIQVERSQEDQALEKDVNEQWIQLDYRNLYLRQACYI